MNLNDLTKGQFARIIGVNNSDVSVCAKLREIGFAEGDEVEVIAYGPFGKTPLCVRLNRTLIALRPAEASAIEVTIQ